MTPADRMTPDLAAGTSTIRDGAEANTLPDARNAGIDCLRGAAIVLVVIHHIALRFPLTRTDLVHVMPYRLLHALNWGGIKGVTIFFVISGFLLTDHTLRRYGAPAALDPWAFSARRAARILPCLIALIAIACVLGSLRIPSFAPEKPEQSLGGAAVSALFMHLNVYEARTGYLPAYWDVLWSLSVEEAFYLGFPLICLTLGRTRAALACCAAALVIAAPFFDWSLRDAPEIWQEKAYAPGMSAIAAGVLAALWLSSGGLRRHQLMLAGCAGAGAMALYLLRGDLCWMFLGHATPLFFNAAIALCVLALAQGWAGSLSGRPTAWLRSWGQRSYEIYLTHMFVVMPASALMRGSGLASGATWLIYPPAIIGVSLLGRLVRDRFSRPVELRLRDALTQSGPGSRPFRY